LSKPIDALISRITAEGPPANRPPHIGFDLPSSLLIGAALSLA
jgi:hypothetical protein